MEPKTTNKTTTTLTLQDHLYYNVIFNDSHGAILQYWTVKLGEFINQGQELVALLIDGDPTYAHSPISGVVRGLCALGEVREGQPIALLEVTKKIDYDTRPIIRSITKLQTELNELRLDSSDTSRNKQLQEEIAWAIERKRRQLLRIYLALKRDEKPPKPGHFWLPLYDYWRLTKDIVKQPIIQCDSVTNYIDISGPTTCELPQLFGDFVACHSTSTYPFLSSKNSRQGDPICDQFHLSISKNNCIVAIADGCNWGIEPATAAKKAVFGFHERIKERLHKIGDTKKMANTLISAFCHAHNTILNGMNADDKIGTTTLLGGILFQLADINSPNVSSSSNNEEWMFMFVTIGDCNAFMWDPTRQVITELNPLGRQNPSDASDCGGRIGPYLTNSRPDLRNLRVVAYPCKPNDVLILCTDGIHDNFDPEMLGKSPNDCGLPFDRWMSKDISATDINRYKAAFRVQKMSMMLNDPHLPVSQVIERLINYSLNLTHTSREFLEQFQNKKLPSNYNLYPGKMDHATCMAIRVCKIDQETFQRSSDQLRSAEFTSNISWKPTIQPPIVTIVPPNDTCQLMSDYDQLQKSLSLPIDSINANENVEHQSSSLDSQDSILTSISPRRSLSSSASLTLSSAKSASLRDSHLNVLRKVGEWTRKLVQLALDILSIGKNVAIEKECAKLMKQIENGMLQLMIALMQTSMEKLGEDIKVMSASLLGFIRAIFENSDKFDLQEIDQTRGLLVDNLTRFEKAADVLITGSNRRSSVPAILTTTTHTQDQSRTVNLQCELINEESWREQNWEYLAKADLSSFDKPLIRFRSTDGSRIRSIGPHSRSPGRFSTMRISEPLSVAAPKRMSPRQRSPEEFNSDSEAIEGSRMLFLGTLRRKKSSGFMERSNSPRDFDERHPQVLPQPSASRDRSSTSPAPLLPNSRTKSPTSLNLPTSTPSPKPIVSSDEAPEQELRLGSDVSVSMPEDQTPASTEDAPPTGITPTQIRIAVDQIERNLDKKQSRKSLPVFK